MKVYYSYIVLGFLMLISLMAVISEVFFFGKVYDDIVVLNSVSSENESKISLL